MDLPQKINFKLFQKIFELVPENLGLIDKDYNLVLYNKAFRNFFNIRETKPGLKKCYEIIGCNELCEACMIMDVFKKEKQIDNEFFLKHKNTWIQQKVTPVHDEEGRMVYVLETVKDIAEYRKVEESLKQQNQDLIKIEAKLTEKNVELKELNRQLKQSKETIEMSRKQYKHLFENMLDGFALHEIVLDDDNQPVDYTFLDINPAFEKLTGLKQKNVIGKRVKEVLPDIDKKWIETYGKVALSGKAVEFENYSSDIDKYFHITAFSPEKHKFAVIFEDVTNRIQATQKLQESDKRYRSMFYDNLAVMLMIDPHDGKIVDANPTACDFYGYSRTEIIHLHIYDINLWSKEKIRSKMAESKNANANVFYNKHKKRNGDIREVRVSSSPMKFDSKIVLFSIIQDVTSENEAKKKLIEKEKQLKEHLLTIQEKNEEYASINEEYLSVNEELSEKNEKFILLNDEYKKLNYRLVEKNEELKKAIQKAAESDKLKTSFLANMSHEIRTPMNGIIGFTDLIQNENLPAEKRKQYSDIIKTSTNQLLTIINDIIDISKIEANLLNLDLSAGNLKEILNKIYVQFENHLQLLNKTDIKLLLELPEWEEDEYFYKVDEVRLTQIINNLLSNALKFTREGHIKVGFYHVNKHIRFYVEDTGKGIAKEKLKIIFERFRQEEESYTRNYGGFGLGLSISKGLVELFEGSIGVESTETKGSMFFFDLPLEPASQPADNE